MHSARHVRAFLVAAALVDLAQAVAAPVVLVPEEAVRAALARVVLAPEEAAPVVLALVAVVAPRK